MKFISFILFLTVSITGCVSKKQYKELILEKKMLENKNISLEQKLENIKIYRQHLLDSLNAQL